MGRDPSLGDMYPSIIINARRYHYGKSTSSDGYIVENARVGKDYWYFKEEADFRAFLINLPESAERGRLRDAHPDWDSATQEQRDAYFAGDRAKQRVLAEARVKAGTAPSYIIDLEGEHGPYAPQQIQPRADAEPPLERLDRQLRQRRREFGGWNDAGKLVVLESGIDWSGISADDKRAVLSREVDFAQITRKQFAFVYEDIAMDNEVPPDATVATRLFEEAHGKSGNKPRVASSPSSDPTGDFSEEKFRQKYWDQRVQFKDEPFSVRVDGTQYILKADHDHLPGFKGHGGRDFYIRFDDGRLIHTANLWLNGEIPPEFRSQLPDNARFLNKVEYEQMLARAEAAVDAPSPSALAADNRPASPTLSTGRTKGKKP